MVPTIPPVRSPLTVLAAGLLVSLAGVGLVNRSDGFETAGRPGIFVLDRTNR